jgi:DNA-binding response OmpR family regulator
MNILVVDDDRDITNLIGKYLTVEGYDVSVACDGEKGLEIFNDERFDLVILDIMMSPINGFEFLQKIREMNKDVIVFFLTAKDAEIDRVYGFRLGADDYIVKPFFINELVERVNSRFRRNKKDKMDSFVFDDITIDFSSCKVLRNNEEIFLRAKEYELLKFFINNRGKVFSKSQIFEMVWNQDYFGDDNTVMVHIRRLREKIEPNPNDPIYIKTIWGLGYRFDYSNE